MPRRKDIEKVLVIGSGPIIIGQAAEFDYAGTQACRALREEGLKVVLVNSNPATIMTDKDIADHVYIEPLIPEVIKEIVLKERPDSVLPTLGGQTGLNLAMELADQGFWDEAGVKLLGTNVAAIRMAEDRQEFKNTMESIGEPCIASKVVESCEDALEFAKEIGYPVIVRPAYTLGGTGGGIAGTAQELKEIASNGLRLSRVHQVLIEKCISGWKEIEFEVMRDGKGNCIAICSMENVDPVGVHTGDSIVVAPAQTLSNREYQMLRSAALNIICALGIEGGCNIQFALNPESFEYAVIEVNPRVSRSSALASKASGYPIAKVASKIAVGYGLDEITNAVTGKTCAFFEPALDYCVIKVPKWPFDKFVKARRTLGTQMKATGEVMSIDTSFEAALMKAIRGAEIGASYLSLPRIAALTDEEVDDRLKLIDDERIFVVAEALRRGITVEKVNKITAIDKFFIEKIKNLVKMEKRLTQLKLDSVDRDTLLEAKRLGFIDEDIAAFTGGTKDEVKALRNSFGIRRSFKMVDTCAAEFDAVTPYYYSTFDEACEVERSDKKKVLVVGSGPIRIGQGIEFDYCSVHCIWAMKKAGWETIIVNNNPETVSTDFDTSDKLYFEPLTPEDVEAVIETERPDGALVQFGGQTAIKLAKSIKEAGVPILGTSMESIDAAEDREKFDAILEECGIPRPKGHTVYSCEEAIKAANELGYPVLVRPSYVLGGQGMEIAWSDSDTVELIEIISRVKQEHPILIDKYLMGKEIEVDAICDGQDVLIPGIMEHLERAGIHSGDSISVYPPQTIDQQVKRRILEYTEKLARKLDVVGLVNIQFVLYGGELYVIEVNPRSSRTVPYISKVTGVPMVDLAVRCVNGEKLKDIGFGTGIYPQSKYIAVKVPVFSFEKLHGVDISLGPEMKSTGEVLGIDLTFAGALYKGLIAAGIYPQRSGGILFTVKDSDKNEMLPIAEQFSRLGYKLYATKGTAKALKDAGLEVEAVSKIGEGSPDTLEIISSGEVQFVINTPNRTKKKIKNDDLSMRRKSIEQSIPCFTSLDTAHALLTALKANLSNMQDRTIDITRL